MGQLIAGPFTTRIMAEFGAEVIKIEPPEKGDPLRNWRHLYNGTSLWWAVQSRNKKSVAVNLKEPEGQELVRRLVKSFDVVVENFRPGTLEKWGLGYDQLRQVNPRIIMVRVSGYGQDGPYRDKAGFGSVGEAMGGLRHVTGYPDRPPTRVGVSLGDALAAMYAVIGALMAIYHRDVKGRGEGQVIDVALYEAVFSMMEGMLPEYDKLGVTRERTGSVLPGIAPSNTYLTKDNKYIVIGGNGDAIFKRLMHLVGRPDLSEDPDLQSNNGRARQADMLDEVIESWTRTRTLQEALAGLDEAKVPAGPIYSIEDMVNDAHFLARGMIQEFADERYGKLKVPGVVPKLSATPGGTDWLGPDLGAHTEEVLTGELKMSQDEIKQLKQRGIIG
jgi:crotonobetainyl-CoA:carnitine CoA-transferase CaiB-like acyl-CoA transferase